MDSYSNTNPRVDLSVPQVVYSSSANVPRRTGYTANPYPIYDNDDSVGSVGRLKNPGIKPASTRPEVVYPSIANVSRRTMNPVYGPSFNDSFDGGKLYKKKKHTKKHHKKGGSKSKKHHKKTRAHRSRHRRRQ